MDLSKWYLLANGPDDDEGGGEGNPHGGGSGDGVPDIGDGDDD